ncbi:CAP domain-containing protein [Aeromicrobium wangtongii]|uniref:CAP domain-containing protein n=1 Tax=Aeromicrobium wangtongii TaxID=2969247 RepID=A0ABY5M1P4_9ACTN|nr:CAP domain-containing protein [Aeromicrobium wangtongii]MCD9198096.1 CAP domain-containing protein [Aeromicrobium wangtongii]UUP12135.1 CAP domain-containing protein [Aeromicrobium wangtongii]
MRRPLLIALFAALLILPVAPASAASSGKIESDVVKKTNAERTKRDLKKLKASSCVDRYAEAHARRQAKAKRMFHQDIRVVLKKCHLSRVGENVAYGYTSVKSVTKAWMKSPGHRRNILTKSYRYIGVGAAKDSSGRWYYAQVFGAR